MRELDEHFNNINSKLDVITTQVQCTNGRVSSLENWRWFITGGLSLLTIMVVPMLIALITILMQ